MTDKPTDRAAGSAMVRSGVALFIGLMLVWLGNSGHYTPWMVFLGVLSCLGVIGLSWRMGLLGDERGLLCILMRLPGYFPWLVWQIVKANIDVARRILAPGHQFSPTLVRIKVLAKTEIGAATYANSITLTPGTISIRVRDGYVLVHALAREGAEELEAGEMNRKVAELEGGLGCIPSS